MPFKKGQKRPENAGIKKGTQRKETVQLKEMILKALTDAGGAKYLYKQAMANPNAFLQLVAKIIPKDVNATITGTLTHEVISGAKDWIDAAIEAKNAITDKQDSLH